MIVILAVNVVMVLLAIGIASGLVPPNIFRGAVVVLHKTIGITLPLPENERVVAVIWIASLLVIGDGILFLLIFFAATVGKA